MGLPLRPISIELAVLKPKLGGPTKTNPSPSNAPRGNSLLSRRPRRKQPIWPPASSASKKMEKAARTRMRTPPSRVPRSTFPTWLGSTSWTATICSRGGRTSNSKKRWRSWIRRASRGAVPTAVEIVPSSKTAPASWTAASPPQYPSPHLERQIHFNSKFVHGC